MLFKSTPEISCAQSAQIACIEKKCKLIDWIIAQQDGRWARRWLQRRKPSANRLLSDHMTIMGWMEPDGWMTNKMANGMKLGRRGLLRGQGTSLSPFAKIQLKKKSHQSFFFVTTSLFFLPKIVYDFFSQINFLANYINMYILKRPIRTRSFKTSTSKLLYNCLLKSQKLILGI